MKTFFDKFDTMVKEGEKMAYKSLYRKYRPCTFDDVCGQEYIIKTLKNAIENNRVSHAYLFTGTRGTGKTTIAKIFAKSVNCLNMIDNKPCGNCEICLNENTDEIQDIIEIDAASNNGVDEIRELKNNIKLVPTFCKYKVYIIDEVHMLSPSAFNALLKTLEEPPSHVIFILATTDPQKLPITIMSRCQRFDFKKISEEEICERLKYIANCEKIDIDDETIYEISKICDGALRDAISIFEQLCSYSNKKVKLDDLFDLKGIVPSNIFIDLINNYIEQNYSNILDIIANIYSHNKDFNILVQNMLNLFRNILINKKAPEYFKKKDITFKKLMFDLSNKLDITSIYNIIAKLEKLSQDLRSSIYPRILFELCLLTDYHDLKDVKNYDNKMPDKLNNDKELEQKYKNIKKVGNKDDKELKHDLKESKDDFDNKNTCDVAKQDILKKRINIEKQSNDKKALINNTIAEASTQFKQNAQKVYLNLDDYLFDSEYKDAVLILKDSIVAAASSDHILLVYKYESLVNENDNKISLIREIFSNELDKIVKVVAISEQEWKEIRPYYLNLKKTKGKIELMDENIKNKKSNIYEPIEDIIDIFGSDIIEMEG